MNRSSSDGLTGRSDRTTSPLARHASRIGATITGSVVPTRSVLPNTSTNSPPGSAPRDTAAPGGCVGPASAGASVAATPSGSASRTRCPATAGSAANSIS
jgi:hypothetical protein